MTEFFKKYVPGFVKENLGQYVSITGGKVVVNGTGLTETQRDDRHECIQRDVYHLKISGEQLLPFPCFQPFCNTQGSFNSLKEIIL